jgi:gluconate 2-dehydrogenase gamma chain
MNRRYFLKSVAAGGTVAVTSWPISRGYAAENSLAPGCKVFTVSQASLVDAIAEQFVPKDDYPGGKEAGVVYFIDGMLAGPFGKFYAERYKRGLQMVDDLSHDRFGRNFVSLNSDEQISILKALQSGAGASAAGREFFTLILQDTMKGYYGDSSHGGNRGETSWKMIKFEG